MENKQTVKFLDGDYSGNGISTNRKENNFCMAYQVIAPPVKGDTFNPVARVIIECRFYCTNAASRCCIWIHSTDAAWRSGGAMAGGYGYHRPSAALESALEKAGVKLSQPIRGRGESAMVATLLAIARTMGVRKAQVIKSHA